MQYVVSSSLVDDVMFSHDGACGSESKTVLCFTQLPVVVPGTKLLSMIAGLFAVCGVFLIKFDVVI